MHPLDDAIHLETNNLDQLGLIEAYIAARLEKVGIGK